MRRIHASCRLQNDITFIQASTAAMVSHGSAVLERCYQKIGKENTYKTLLQKR